MCGIVGVFSVNQGWSLSEDELKKMRDQMISRGPDDAGVFTHQEEGLFVGLGHRRLSIIDLSPFGHQPMSTSDQSYWIVFNGEIFNYQELREELFRTGRYLFKSKSDTEVLLYGIREWGVEGCLKRLRGMYAFALFDKAKGSLILVRDPLGVKPLYYCHQPGMIAFASEIKAILALPGMKKSIDDLAFYHYLTFSNSPAPQTLFEGISKLEAGTWLKINRSGIIRQGRYWNPARFNPEERPLEEEACIEELRRLLRQSVSRRMVSDVPFGVFLSGGLDSSLNVALMAEQMAQPVETFSVGIKGDSANEFEFARKVAQRFGTHHHELLIDDDDFISFLPEMPFFQDEPLADPVCVPLYYLSKLARKSGTTVIQVGEGSDELFAGYPIYHRFNRWNTRVYQPYLKTPGLIRSLLSNAAGKYLSAEKEDLLRRAGEGSPLFMGNAIAFWDVEKNRLVKKPFLKESSSRYIERLSRPFQISDPLLSIINTELKNRLPELLLMRVDKMSMASSIETRVPFLDEDLVEFALTLPSRLKFRNGETKYILKKAAEGILPDEVIYRKKWGFCGSATNMLSEKLVSYARRRIMESPLIAERFNRNSIERLFKNHQEQKRFNSFKIWNLLNLVLWHSRWFESV